MSDTLWQQSISASSACITSYFTKNNVDSSALSFLRPIAITAQRNPSGWMAKRDRVSLLNIISRKINKTIRIVEFGNDNMAPDVNGFVVEKESSADIYVKKNSEGTYFQGLNFCYRRFIVAKELNHLLMNKDVNLQTVKYVAEFIDLVSFLTSDAIPKDNGQKSEYIAYYGAMELLIPKQYFDSDWFKSQNDNHNIALQLRCPAQVIEIRKDKENQKKFLEAYQTLRAS